MLTAVGSINKWRQGGMVKVSVVVPVYNQEKYLERCMDSILGQTLKEIEVIAVDDGSQDSTPEILSRYQQEDSRVTVLHQQNLYAGIARNNGLQAAHGEYVIFWDSDDYFAEDALEALYDEIKRRDADICVGESTRMDMQTGEVKEKCYLNWDRIPEKRPFSIHDIPQYIFNFGINCTWNKLYKRAFLEQNGLRFSGLKQANDVYFVMAAFVLAGKITVVDSVVAYYQFRNTGSLSGNALHVRENLLQAYLDVKGFLEETGNWENEDIRSSFVNKAFGTMAFRFSMSGNYEEYQELYAYFKEKALPALGIGEADVSRMYSDKNAFELSKLLSCDAGAYAFEQFLFYQKKVSQHRDRISKMRDKLSKADKRNQNLKERVENLKGDMEKRAQKIQRQGERIEKQSEKIQQKNEKIQKQGERIERQSEKIQSQQALLDKKLVKAAVKVQNLFS